jgi:hypothetical protein
MLGHGAKIMAVSDVILLQAVVISWLLYERRQRRRSEA